MVTVRLPDPLVAEIDAESQDRGVSRSDIVRERLQGSQDAKGRRPASLDAVADLVGSVDGLPADLSTGTKRYLQATGYGRKRHR